MARIGTPTAGQWCVGLRPGSFGAGWRRKSTADSAAPMAAAGAAAATEPTGAACSANHPATSNRRSRGSSARRRHPEYPANGRIRSSVPAPAGSSNRPSKPPTDHMVRKTELMRRPGPATPVNGQVRQSIGHRRSPCRHSRKPSPRGRPATSAMSRRDPISQRPAVPHTTDRRPEFLPEAAEIPRAPSGKIRRSGRAGSRPRAPHPD